MSKLYKISVRKMMKVTVFFFYLMLDFGVILRSCFLFNVPTEKTALSFITYF